jgi:glutamate dehydrogenase (NAD(P)+)
VAVCDADGVVANPAGLDVEQLLLTRDRFGRVDRAALRSSDAVLAGDAWLDVPAEILVPAAVSYAIDDVTVARVRAALVVEAANAATTPTAADLLHRRGVTVIPDFVANVAANAWWWWTLFGDIEPEPVDAFAKISVTLRTLVIELLDRAKRGRTGPREAALAMAAERLAAARC